MLLGRMEPHRDRDVTEDALPSMVWLFVVLTAAVFIASLLAISALNDVGTFNMLLVMMTTFDIACGQHSLSVWATMSSLFEGAKLWSPGCGDGDRLGVFVFPNWAAHCVLVRL